MKMKKRKVEKSIYQILGQQIDQRLRVEAQATVNINATIRQLRKEKGLSGVDLCRAAGDLDPRTLTALEKGRIKNPSIKTLTSVARGLGIPLSHIFRHAEIQKDHYLYAGTQKGYYQMEFPWLRLKIVSFTPFVRDFFYGKLIFSGRCRLEHTFLPQEKPIFVSVLVGRMEIRVENKVYHLKEGQNLFFNGALNHVFQNPLYREAVLMMITAPSFLAK